MLGRLSSSTAVFDTTLSSGVRLISKPSALHVPPWQMVSAVLGAPAAASGPPLRTANWWATPAIPSTSSAGDPGCWGLPQHPGPVAIATNGVWSGRPIGLWGGHAPNGNHAKIGVSLGGAPYYAIFGDLNQQGSLSPAAKAVYEQPERTRRPLLRGKQPPAPRQRRGADRRRHRAGRGVRCRPLGTA